MNALFWNIAYIALFVAAGTVIIKTLQYFKMRIAAIAFGVLFCALLLYIPFFFGGRLAIVISDLLFSDSLYAAIFVEFTLSRLAASFVFVRSVSLVTALAALIIAAAAVIVSIAVAKKVVSLVRRYISRRRTAVAPRAKLVYPRFVYILNNQNIYKRLLRLLN